MDSGINLLHLERTAIVHSMLMATPYAFCQYVLFTVNLDSFLAGSFAILCHTSPALLCWCFPALQLKIIPLGWSSFFQKGNAVKYRKQVQQIQRGKIFHRFLPAPQSFHSLNAPFPFTPATLLPRWLSFNAHTKSPPQKVVTQHPTFCSSPGSPAKGRNSLHCL